MRWTTAVLLGALILGGFPSSATAHGLVNAGELETLFVQDEASDLMTGADLGFDLLQIYVGEAFVPQIGDGLYVHTVLYGGAGARPAVDGPMSVRFTFMTDKGEFVRTLSTTDGATFESDFEALSVEPGDGEVEIQRAFVKLPAGVGPGTVLKALKAESFVGDDLRDVAPGGAFLRGIPISEPMAESKQVVDSYTLKGPVGYVTATVRATSDGFAIDAHNPLKKGDQHIMLAMPADQDGWEAEVSGGGEVKAGGNTTFLLKLKPGDGPLAFDLLTDIGGHIPLRASDHDGKVVLAIADAEASSSDSPPKESPLGLWIALSGLAVVLMARRQSS